mgnify:FL=1
MESLSSRAYSEIRRRIIRLELAPGAVIDERDLQDRLDIGRTPVREALQRLARDQFVVVMPRRGMLVSSIDVSELSMLYETRAVMEPYAARLACARGTQEHWAAMSDTINQAPSASADETLLDIDRRCHEITWAAASNRFLTDNLDMLYAHSDRVWHMYLAAVADTRHAVVEHGEILDALAARDADRAAALVEAHIRSFDEQVRRAVSARLGPPLSTGAPLNDIA